MGIVIYNYYVIQQRYGICYVVQFPSRFKSDSDEAKMVVGMIISTWLGVWFFHKVFSMMRDCLHLALFVVVVAVLVYCYPEQVQVQTKHIQRYFRNQPLPDVVWQVIIPLKQTLRYSLIFIADRLNGIAEYLR